MISVSDAISLLLAGGVLSLVGVFSGVIIHTRWLDRKLAPKKVTQATKGVP